MTVFAESLFTFLAAAATSAESRIYPNALPQGVTLPAIRYLEVSEPPERTYSGPSLLQYPRYQLDCVADGEDAYLDAVRLANQVITAIDGFTGNMGTTQVFAGFKEDKRDSFDPDTGRHTVSVDVIVWHQKPV